MLVTIDLTSIAKKLALVVGLCFFGGRSQLSSLHISSAQLHECKGTALPYGLSPEQTDVFLEKFSNDKSDQAILEVFHISDGTLRYRMGEIYKKFSINGKGTGKAHQLLSFLTKEYQKCNASASPSFPFFDEPS